MAALYAINAQSELDRMTLARVDRSSSRVVYVRSLYARYRALFV